jgi:hypothetical protein
MSMVRQDKLGSKSSPFHDFICGGQTGGCGKRLGSHFLFRHEKQADLRGGPDSRKPDGKLYCHRDQTSYAGAYYQRQLRRTMVTGYSSEGAN